MRKWLLSAALLLAIAAGIAGFAQKGDKVQAAQAPANAVPVPPPQPNASMEKEKGNRPAGAEPLLHAQMAQLLRLANQLQTDVGKTNKDTLSISVIREAAEIEKLTRTMRAERLEHASHDH